MPSTAGKSVAKNFSIKTILLGASGCVAPPATTAVHWKGTAERKGCVAGPGRTFRKSLGLAVAALALAADPGAAAELVFSGSTTVETRILVPLTKDIKVATDIDVTTEGVGSGNGLKRLIAGEVSAAIISSELKSLLERAHVPDDGTYRQHTIVEDIIVPITNAENPVKELTWEQLKGIFSGTIRNWKEVGGGNLPIKIITSHPESATREVVWELVMEKKADFSRSARIVYATKKEMVLVAESAGAIGAVSQGFVDQYIADARKNGDPVEISVVATKRIMRPLAIVTKGEPSPQIAKLLAFLATEQTQSKFK